MTPGVALVALAEAGVVVWLDGDRLRFRAPPGALTDGLRAEVVRCRPGLVALVAAGGALPPQRERWPEGWRAAWEERAGEERAGVMEFEGGLPREAAEREAERAVRVDHARAFVASLALS